MHKKSNLLGLMMPGKEERSNDNAIIGEYGRDTKRTDSSINHAPMIFIKEPCIFTFGTS